MKRLLAVIATLVIAVGLAACGDDDDATTTTAPAPTTAPATGPEGEGTFLTLTGEATTLTLDEGTAGILSGAGVDVGPVEPAEESGQGIEFPITGGAIDSTTLAGTIEHSGGLVFSFLDRDLELTDFIIDTDAGNLSALAGGERVTILDVDLANVRRTDEDDTIVLENITAGLSTEGADALNDALGTDIFSEGIRLGEVTIRATE
jgi:hypothetical protein